MAQADILVELIKSASIGDQVAVRKVTETLIQEERAKGHRILAERLLKSLQTQHSHHSTIRKTGIKDASIQELVYEIAPEKALDSLILSKKITSQVNTLIEEQQRAELLHAYNLSPRNRILLAGPP